MTSDAPYWWGDELASLRASIGREIPSNYLGGSADFVVIGAGFTGLAAALELAQAGADVLVLEAGEIGIGASTRNAGMCGSPHKFGLGAASQLYGPDLAAQMFNEGREAYAHLQKLLAKSPIDARWQPFGRLRLAWTPTHMRALEAEAAILQANSPEKLRLLDKQALQREIGSDRYFGALLHEDHGGLDPARWFAGLAQMALLAGVKIVSDVAVQKVDVKGARTEIVTTQGLVKAKQVILATNGLTADLGRETSARIFRVPSYLIATEELPASLIDEIAPARRMMVETRRRSGYFRISPDGKRLIYGGRAAVHDIPLSLAKKRLHRLMCESFPQLRDVAITHCWTGPLGFSFSGHPHVGRADGMIHALGYSGNGVALSPWLGRKAALMAMGRKDGQTVFSQTQFTTRPWRPLMRLSMAPASWMQYPLDWRENAESWLARRR